MRRVNISVYEHINEQSKFLIEKKVYSDHQSKNKSKLMCVHFYNLG